MIKKSLLFSLLFICINTMYAKFSFFAGFGSSFGDIKTDSIVTNSLTRGTSSAGFVQGDKEIGYYQSTFNDINSFYMGSEGNLDKNNIFILRGYIIASYANALSIGNIQKSEKINGEKTFPNTKAGQTTQNNFNDLPGLDLTSPIKNALFLAYGVGADLSINIPISDIVSHFSNYKMFPFAIGFFGGGGFEFVTLSVGSYTNVSFKNNKLNENDTFYAAGSGMFARFGLSIYALKNVRLDLGLKVPFISTAATKYYIYPQNNNDPFTQQLLIQTIENHINGFKSSYYFISLNVIF